jgi:uncharacterized protein YndB with AHSA1/START domain
MSPILRRISGLGDNHNQCVSDAQASSQIRIGSEIDREIETIVTKENLMTNNDKKLIANSSTTINAPVDKVWQALVKPDLIKQYMFGTNVVTDWQEGSPIVWQGEWQGKAYEDKGTILKIEQERILQYSHFSPLTGQPDVPENYHTVTIELSGAGGQTQVTLSQDNNETKEAREDSEKNWQMMLDSLKKLLES